MSILVLILQLFSCDIGTGSEMFLIAQKDFLYFIFIKSIILISIIRYHIGIRLFNERYYVYQECIFLSILLMQSGDIESNPGPMFNRKQQGFYI